MTIDAQYFRLAPDPIVAAFWAALHVCATFVRKILPVGAGLGLNHLAGDRGAGRVLRFVGRPRRRSPPMPTSKPTLNQVAHPRRRPGRACQCHGKPGSDEGRASSRSTRGPLNSGSLSCRRTESTRSSKSPRWKRNRQPPRPTSTELAAEEDYVQVVQEQAEGRLQARCHHRSQISAGHPELQSRPGGQGPCPGADEEDRASAGAQSAKNMPSLRRFNPNSRRPNSIWSGRGFLRPPMAS